MPYTVLAWVSVCESYQCQGTHINNNIAAVCRTCLANHIGFISHHIMLLVINSLGDGHTCKHTHTNKYQHRNNFKKPGACRPVPIAPSLNQSLIYCC